MTGVFADDRIDATEFQAATNVVSTGVEAVGADVIGYSFVASGDLCETGTSYKDPLLSNDISLTVNGSYKVCTKLEDLAGNIFYDEITPSYFFDVDKDTPTILSVSLIGDASDSFINNTENAASNPIVSVDANGHDTLEYKLIADSLACSTATQLGLLHYLSLTLRQ